MSVSIACRTCQTPLAQAIPMSKQYGLLFLSTFALFWGCINERCRPGGGGDPRVLVHHLPPPPQGPPAHS